LDASDGDIGAPFDAGPLKAAVNVGDVQKWLTDRGVPASQLGKFGNSTGCVEFTVGTAREAALVCTEVKEESRKAATAEGEVYRMMDHRIARVVRGGSLVSVLDAEIMLEPLDKEMRTQKNLLDLTLHFAPDGMSATIVDRGTSLDDCASVQQANVQVAHAKSSAGDPWSRFDQDLETRMCNASGGYVWQGDHFVRDPNWKAPPASKVKAAPTSTQRTRDESLKSGESYF
ncbi:MAG: hypothetical protein ACRELY_11095, partial [Polyangiaceae bacterium]